MEVLTYVVVIINMNYGAHLRQINQHQNLHKLIINSILIDAIVNFRI